MSTETYQNAKLRSRLLKVWLTQNLPLANLRNAIRKFAPYANLKQEEAWFERNVPNYYQLRKAEINAWDDEHIKKVLKGAGFLP